jgi:hypothetical protein
LIGQPAASLAAEGHGRSEVVWHSKDRDEVYRKAFEFECKCLASLYAGPIPAPGKAIVL